jgi:uncharacterized protein YndB with AHSA1/START domain
MTVIDVRKDTTNLTVTVVAQFNATVDAVWQLWADPRKLERWWGPPTYPATVTEHNFAVGGTVSYYMTGPDGDTPSGAWTVLALEEPHRLTLRDYFTDEHGAANTAMPTMTMDATVEALAEGSTQMTLVTTFASLDQMQQLLDMGMEEGMTAAWGQMDDIVASAA